MFCSEIGPQKLGQPVPESNFVSDLNKSLIQHTHWNIPFSLKLLYLPVKGGSVPFFRVILYCSGVSIRFHSSSLLIIFSGMVVPFWSKTLESLSANVPVCFSAV